jgi:hypothetical protein
MSDIDILTETLNVEDVLRTALITKSDYRRKRSYREENSTVIFSGSSSILCWFLTIIQVADSMRWTTHCSNYKCRDSVGRVEFRVGTSATRPFASSRVKYSHLRRCPHKSLNAHTLHINHYGIAKWRSKKLRTRSIYLKKNDWYKLTWELALTNGDARSTTVVESGTKQPVHCT